MSVVGGVSGSLLVKFAYAYSDNWYPRSYLFFTRPNKSELLARRHAREIQPTLKVPTESKVQLNFPNLFQ